MLRKLLPLSVLAALQGVLILAVWAAVENRLSYAGSPDRTPADSTYAMTHPACGAPTVPADPAEVIERVSDAAPVGPPDVGGVEQADFGPYADFAEAEAEARAWGQCGFTATIFLDDLAGQDAPPAWIVHVEKPLDPDGDRPVLPAGDALARVVPAAPTAAGPWGSVDAAFLDNGPRLG